jgi:hypothetical protein
VRTVAAIVSNKGIGYVVSSEILFGNAVTVYAAIFIVCAACVSG